MQAVVIAVMLSLAFSNAFTSIVLSVDKGIRKSQSHGFVENDARSHNYSTVCLYSYYKPIYRDGKLQVYRTKINVELLITL